MAAWNTRRYRLVQYRQIPVVGVVDRVHQRMFMACLRVHDRTVRVRVRCRLLRGSELYARKEMVS
jgi:hypothetical protein